jgi:hypothetical protein
MNIKYTIDKEALTLTADEEAREDIRELIESESHCGWRWMEVETLDWLTSNSELQWVSAVDTGDMTDAPMLGIVGGENEETRENKGPFGAVYVGGDEKGPIYAPILERWGFMDYAVRSFLEDLISEGKAVFVNRN